MTFPLINLRLKFLVPKKSDREPVIKSYLQTAYIPPPLHCGPQLWYGDYRTTGEWGPAWSEALQVDDEDGGQLPDPELLERLSVGLALAATGRCVGCSEPFQTPKPKKIYWVRTKSITIKKRPSSPRLRSEIWNGGVGNKSGYQNKNAGGNKNITKTSARTHTAQSRFESNLNPYLKKNRVDFFGSALWFDMPRPSPSFPIPHCSQPLGPVGWEQ